ncbi:MAG: c-type cytochrome [Candidatus Sedimenticola sp. (ex Thyasira tokunagai)]
MTANKTLITALGIITASLMANPAQALDAASLYKERTCIACHGAEGRVPAMDEYPKIAGQTAPYMLAQMKDIKNGSRASSHSAAMRNVMHMTNDEEMAILVEWLSGLPEGASASATTEDAAEDGAQLYLTKACASCHGADGRTPLTPVFPKVAGQNAGYIFNQLRDTKNGSRNNGQTGVMKGIIANVTEVEMRTIANWLSTQ